MNQRFAPIKYVVPGVIVEGLTLFAAKPKTGKSWLLLHVALAAARNGFTLGDIHCKEGDVLYCALEDNQRRMKSRLGKLLGTTAWPTRRRHQTRDEAARRGRARLTSTMDRERPHHPRMVIIDTLAMVRPPRSERPDRL